MVRNKKRWLIVLLILIIIMLFTRTYWRDWPMAKAVRRGTFLTLTAMSQGFHNVGSGLNNLFAGLGRLSQAEAENTRLKAQLERASIELIQYKSLLKDNQLLRKELGFRDTTLYEFQVTAAEIIARSPDSWFESIIIDKGSRDGIRENMAVICRQGAVGRIIETSAQRSKVMLITDPNSNISSEVVPGQVNGIAQGQGAMNMILKYIPRHIVLREGQLVETSGISFSFPQGIPVARVIKTLKQKNDYLQYVELEPLVDLTSLDKVWIIHQVHGALSGQVFERQNI